MTDPNGQLTAAKYKSKMVADKRRQNEAITIDQALEEISSPRKMAEVDSLLRSIKLIDFHLEQRPNRLFELDLHLVISAKALLLISSGIAGVVVLVVKLFSH